MSIITDDMVNGLTVRPECRNDVRANLEAIANDIIEECAKQAEKIAYVRDDDGILMPLNHMQTAQLIRSLKTFIRSLKTS